MKYIIIILLIYIIYVPLDMLICWCFYIFSKCIQKILDGRIVILGCLSWEKKLRFCGTRSQLSLHPLWELLL